MVQGKSGKSHNLHACAVVIGATGVLIRGRSGTGKTALALQLVEETNRLSRFARLVADDQVFLSKVHGRLVVHRPGPIAGLAEIRGLGLVPHPSVPSAVIHLVVDIVDPERLERMPEDETIEIEDVTMRHIHVPAKNPHEASNLVIMRLGQMAQSLGSIAE